jgi:aspartyl-tRNA synthetase
MWNGKFVSSTSTDFFDQLDLEMGFARAKDVRRTVGGIINNIFNMLRRTKIPREVGGVLYSTASELVARDGGIDQGNSEYMLKTDNLWPMTAHRAHSFHKFRYGEVMTNFGTDKPDLRIPANVSIPCMVGLLDPQANACRSFEPNTSCLKISKK